VKLRKPAKPDFTFRPFSHKLSVSLLDDNWKPVGGKGWSMARLVVTLWTIEDSVKKDTRILLSENNIVF